MQTWPWCMNAPNAPADAAAATSAPGSTTRALLPPSSRWARLRLRPQASPTFRPAAVEPVKDTTRISGASDSAAPASAPPVSSCSTPAGRPASSKARMIITPPVTGVRGSGLRITALPSARAGATERMERISGKLKGEITPTTPAGTRRAKDQCASSEVSTSPAGWCGSPAESKHSLAATWVSIAALPPIAPVSRWIQVFSSSTWSSKT